MEEWPTILFGKNIRKGWLSCVDDTESELCDGQAQDAAPTTMNLQHGSSTPQCSLVDSAKPYAV